MTDRQIRVDSVETPEAPEPRVPFDLLAPEHGWFRALRHPQYRFFWTGNFVSNVGSWMQNIAQGWLVFQLTNSPFLLGLVGFAQQIPALIFSLPAGVLADRTQRRRMLLATQTVMMLLAFILAWLTWSERITVESIIVLAFLAGTTMALNAPTYQAAVRDLVEEQDTLNAIALNSIQFNLSRVLGPSVAGFAIAAFGVAICFFLNALSYVALLFVLWHTRFPPRHNQPDIRLRADLVEGFRYVWTHRTILLLVLLVALVSTFGLPYLVMMPVFASEVLEVGAVGLGYLTAAAGVGALAGGIFLAQQKSHARRGPLVLNAAMAFFAAILAFCLSRNVALSALLLAAVGFAMVSSVATVNSLIQTNVPDAIRGRVLSMHTMAFLGFTPLGSLLVGALAERWDAPTALALSSGFAFLVTAVIAVTARGVRELQ
jgi:MFS family permease